jgi:oligopeptide transport system substrate-binding protein
VRLKGAVFHPIDNVDAEERAFRGGLLHVTRNLPVVKLPVYRQEQPKLVRTDELVETKYIDMNVRRAPFTDVRVRRAFATAVDREALVRDVMRDGSRVADNLTIPGSGGYTARVHLPYDGSKARAALAEAGFANGANFPPVSLVFTPAHQGEQAMVEALQGMWQRELGVHVDLVAQEEKVWLNTMRSKDFQMLTDGWLSGINDPVDMFQLFLGNSPNNNSGWDDAGYNEEFAAAGSAPDDAAREVHLQSMDAALLDGLPMLPLFHQSQNYLVHPSVQGWQVNMLGWHLLNQVYLQAPAPPAKPAS